MQAAVRRVLRLPSPSGRYHITRERSRLAGRLPWLQMALPKASNTPEEFAACFGASVRADGSSSFATPNGFGKIKTRIERGFNSLDV